MIRRFFLASSCGRLRLGSMRSSSHLRIPASGMCMNSTPIVRQYVSRRMAISSSSVE